MIGNTEGTTGTKRGLVLTLMSLASFLSPLAMGHIIGENNNLAGVYYIGALVGLIYIAFIISKFRFFVDPVYKKISFKNLFSETLQNKNISTVLTTQFILQFFFTWTIVYFPLHMSQTAGFDWEQIGIITASGLLAYVIFEYPIGILADNKFGEKEMMALGFAIIAITSASLSFLPLVGIGSWMIVMFINRFGASLVEVTNESYFFKHVTGHDSNLISLFRLMRPLANLFGALAGSLSLLFMPINYIFIVLAIFMIFGAFMTQRLVDTK
jgi:MFS family permease